MSKAIKLIKALPIKERAKIAASPKDPLAKGARVVCLPCSPDEPFAGRWRCKYQAFAQPPAEIFNTFFSGRPWLDTCGSFKPSS